MTSGEELRVAFVTGGLSQGGAEKQLLYMLRALRRRGVTLRVYCLTRGEFYERHLHEEGIEPIWIGRFRSPAVRLAHLARLAAGFRPHVVQSGHFFTNLYAAGAAACCRALSIGSIRNDARFELALHRWWGPGLLRLPQLILANSVTGRRNAQAHGRRPADMAVLPNVIELPEFDAEASTMTLDLRAWRGGVPLVAAVGRLVPAKRFDRFVDAIARARRTAPALRAVLIGEGPERERLERRAHELGLTPEVFRFLGARADVPALLRQADILVLCSDHEGFPNVLLEGMAAGIPAVATPAGDAATILVHGVAGFVVPPDRVDILSGRIVDLVTDGATRARMGRAARRRVETEYRADSLADRLFEVYRQAASRRRAGLALPLPSESPTFAEPAHR